ncbi:MAG: pyrroline-5-carboxylate reductase, partial [bacterium]|nr:pyrroline-5-carboxylate reductase [bacterium]
GLNGHRRIIRCMPNTPALTGKGITAIASLPEVTSDEIELAEALLGVVGDVVRVEEGYMDAVTGLSGSGPAYVYTFIEALIDAGVRVGLPRDLARRLALATVTGATDMVAESGLHPASLRDMVTSPGGTTIAAMEKLEREGFRTSIYSAVAAAAERSAELSK